MHAHIDVPAVYGLVADQPGLAAEQAVQFATFGAESIKRNVELMTTSYRPLLDDLRTRLAQMDAAGVGIHAISVVPTLYHYWADAPLANDIVAAANEHIAAAVAAQPDRLVGLATVALQHPEPQRSRICLRSVGRSLRPPTCAKAWRHSWRRETHASKGAEQ